MATIVGLQLISNNLPAHDDYLMRLGEHLLLEHRQLTQKVVIEPLTPEEIQELHEEHHYFGIDNG